MQTIVYSWENQNSNRSSCLYPGLWPYSQWQQDLYWKEPEDGGVLGWGRLGGVVRIRYCEFLNLSLQIKFNCTQFMIPTGYYPQMISSMQIE